MAWSTSIAGKCCAACTNWGGPRKVNSLKRAETDRSMRVMVAISLNHGLHSNNCEFSFDQKRTAKTIL